MKLPEIQYGGSVETLGRYSSNAPAIIAKTGEVTAAAQLKGAAATAKGIAQSGDMIGRAITSAGTALANEKYRATAESNNAKFQHQAALKKLDIYEDANRDTAMVDAAASLAKTGLNLYSTYLQNRAKDELFTASTSAAAEMQQAQNSWMQQGGIPATHLEGYEGDTTLPDGSVKMLSFNEALPQMYKQQSEQTINKYAEGISNQAAREAFVREATLEADAKYFKLAENAIANQQKEQQAMQKAAIKDLADSGQYNLAINAVEASTMPEADKVVWRSDLRKGKETGEYAQVLMSGSMRTLEATSIHLKDESYTGELSPTDRLTWANRMDSEIRAKEIQARGNVTAAKAVTTDTLNTYIDLYAAGKPQDITKVGQVLAQAQALGVNPIKIAELAHAVKVQPMLTQMARSPLAERAKIASSFTTAAQSPQEQLFAIKVQQQFDKIGKQLDADPLQYAETVGVVGDLGPMEPADPSFWQNRRMAQLASEENFGVASTLLKNSEAKQLSTQFSQMSAGEQVNMINLWQASLGEDSAQDLLEQINLDIKSLPLIPNLAEGLGEQALHGNRVRKENPAMVPPKDFQMDMTEKLFGNAFLGDATMRTAARELTTDLYLAEAEKNGWFDGTNPQTPESFKDHGWVFDNKERVDLGVISYGDRDFIAPEKGLTSNEFESWVSMVSPVALVRGRALGISDHELMLRVNQGSFLLTQIGNKEFKVFDPETSLYVPNKETGRALVLDYDGSLPTIGVEINAFNADVGVTE